jgi:hypothetical protein
MTATGDRVQSMFDPKSFGRGFEITDPQKYVIELQH